MPVTVDTTKTSAKKILMVVANPGISELTGWPVGFWVSEFVHPWYEFTGAGYEVTLASSDGGKVEMDFLSDPDHESGYSREDRLSRGFLKTPQLTAMSEDTPKLADVDLDEFDAIGSAAARGRCTSSAGTPACSSRSHTSTWRKADGRDVPQGLGADRCEGERLEPDRGEDDHRVCRRRGGRRRQVTFQSAAHWLVISMHRDWHEALSIHSGELARQIGEVAFAGKAAFDVPKILLVEDDVDITELREVVWAFATRAHPEHGEVHFRNLPTQRLSVYLSLQEAHSYRSGKVIYNCLLADRFAKQERPVKGSFENGWPPEIQQRVLTRWTDYGYPAAAVPG